MSTKSRLERLERQAEQRALPPPMLIPLTIYHSSGQLEHTTTDARQAIRQAQHNATDGNSITIVEWMQ